MKKILLSCLILLFFASCGEQKAEGKKNYKWEVSRYVSTAIDINSLYFNSRDLFCKKPFGAVKVNTDVTLKFLAKKGDLKMVKLVLSKQTIVGNSVMERYKKFKSIEMKKIGTTNNSDIWSATFKLSKIGVYGYHFELYKNNEDGIVWADNIRQLKIPYVKVKGTGGIGRISALKKYKIPFTLTVYNYKNNLSRLDGGIIYYIFPERFKNGNHKNDPVPGKTLFYDHKTVEVHKYWNDPKPWVPGKTDGNTNDDNEYCNNFYGGDLEGIIKKLDYIRSLGVTIIYINPIFFAPSNHKYDTADYMKIDPHFGTLKTFKKLVAEAKKRGMKILLDTSLNHCGSDSIYMDRYGKYPTLGAFENQKIRKDSPYYDWFEFVPNVKDADHKYQQWANPTLANLKESESFKKFAFKDKNSVMQYWLSLGAGGWRMDVTPWVSDNFWREWRTAIKKRFPDAFTVCEVWFDASKYLTGDMFDSTMNYIFRQAVLDFARGKNAKKSMDALEMLRENYPPEAFTHAMNLISSHDLPRAYWELGYKKPGSKKKQTASQKLRLAMAFQFFYPGLPAIYYGDEVGMTGGHDPFNRGPYPWKEDGGDGGDRAVLSYIKKLVSLRKKHPALAKGDFTPVYSDKHLIIFKRSYGNQSLTVVLNNSKEAQPLPTEILTSAKQELFNGEIPSDGKCPARGIMILE